MIRTVVNRSVAKVFQISVFQIAVEDAVDKYLAEPNVTKIVAPRANDLPSFTVPVTKLVKREVEKNCLDKAQLSSYEKCSKKESVCHKAKMEDKFWPQKMESVRSRAPLINISNDEMPNRNTYSTIMFTSP